MKLKMPFAAGMCVLSLPFLVSPAGSQPPQNQNQRQPPAETVSPDIPGVVAGGTKVEIVKTGLMGTEGPVGLPDGSVVFCEPAGSKVGKLDSQGNYSVFVEQAYAPAGLGFDPKGRLVAAEDADGHVGVGIIYPKGSEAMLADTYDGKPLLRPNDLVISSKGDIYFTDPGANPLAGGGAAKPLDPDALPYAVYHISPTGKLTRVVVGSDRPNPIWRPNGIQLSPDEKTLYVNDSYGEYILAFDIQPDGTVTNRRNFAKYAKVDMLPNGIASSQSDGLIVDSEGRLYTCGLGGVQVFSNKGEYLGTIPIPVQHPQNLTFAGKDKKTLYVVAAGIAFKVAMLSQGLPNRAK